MSLDDSFRSNAGNIGRNSVSDAYRVTKNHHLRIGFRQLLPYNVRRRPNSLVAVVLKGAPIKLCGIAEQCFIVDP
jgi:hypothetical protein